MGSPRVLQLTPPYGTAFTLHQAITGGPYHAWLMYDESQTREVLEWLRMQVQNFETELTNQAKALYAQQAAQAAQAEQPAQQAPVAIVAQGPVNICKYCGMPRQQAYSRENPRQCCRRGREEDLGVVHNERLSETEKQPNNK